MRKRDFRRQLDEVIDFEIENVKMLKTLVETSQTHFMAVSETGETPFMYGKNLPELLARKIELTESHRSSPPFIDDQIIWKTN